MILCLEVEEKRTSWTDLSLLYRTCGTISKSCSVCCLLQPGKKYVSALLLFYERNFIPLLTFLMYVCQKATLLLKERANLNCIAFKCDFYSFLLISVTNCTGCTSVKLFLVVAINLNEFIVAVWFMFWMTVASFPLLSCFLSWFTMKDLHAACIFTPTINTAVLLSHTYLCYLRVL